MKSEILQQANSIQSDIDFLEILSRNLDEENVASLEIKTNKGITFIVSTDPIDIKKTLKGLREITDAKLKKARRELSKL